MHGIESLPNPSMDATKGKWYRDMTRYHWFVLLVAALGWLFDCLDQQLFTLSRVPALKELLGLPGSHPDVKAWGGYVTSIFLIGWATGGLFFGVLGDRIGRAKTMMITILMYSLCTGLSALSVGVYDFAAYRFLTGLGVGGEFAVGVALVAEVMPESARARSLAFLQALSAIGNVAAAMISLGSGHLEATGVSAWRIMFVIGALPALLALVIRSKLKEPEKWQKLKATLQEDVLTYLRDHDAPCVQCGYNVRGASQPTCPECGKKLVLAELVTKRIGSYRALFKHPVWRRNAIIGLLLASTGVIGLWGIGFFSADLARAVFGDDVAPGIYDGLIADATAKPDEKKLNQVADLTLLKAREAMTPAQRNAAPALTDSQKVEEENANNRIAGKLTEWASITLLMQQVGAFLGMYSFGYFANRVGRKPTFAVAFVTAGLSTAMVFWYLDKPGDIFWMVPIMGFFQLSVFAGYAIYFTELFPTYLRSTGTSFCYNVGRFVAATGPLILGLLTSKVFTGEDYPEPLPWRYAGVSMCSIFILGLIVLPFAPETRGKPLPE